MRLRFTTEARGHLESIKRFLSERNPGAARRIMAEMNVASERLRSFPHVGRKSSVEGTREWAVQRTPYVMVYETQEDEVVVIGVFHGAQDRRSQVG